MLCACPAHTALLNSLLLQPSAVKVERDWFDYLTAFGGLAAVLLAAGALYFAWRSANDSSRSADAAEATAEAAADEARNSRDLLDITREQHERLMRKPELGTGLQLDCPLTHGRNIPFVLQCRFINDGDVAAINSTAYIGVPQGMGLAACGPGGAQMTAAMSLTVATGELLAQGTTQPLKMHSWDIPLIQAKHGHIWHGVFYFPGPGSYEVELRLVHSEAGETRDRYEIEIEDDRAGAFSLIITGKSSLL